MPRRRLSPKQRISFIILLDIFALVLLSWFSFSQTSELFTAYRWVYHTHQVIEKIAELKDQVDDVQRGARGYLLTQDPNFMGPYSEAVHLLPRTLDQLTEMTKDNHSQQENLQTLRPRIDNLIGIYTKAIELRKTYPVDKLKTFFKKGAGPAAMSSVMSIVTEMKEEENLLLSIRNAEEQRRSQAILWVIFGMTGLLAFVLIIAGININRHIENEKIAAEKLREKDAVLFQFLEALPIGVFVIEANRKPFYQNKEATRILGRGLATEKGSEDLAQAYKVYRGDSDQIYPTEEFAITKALKGQSTDHADMDIHQPDGIIIPIHVWGTPIYDSLKNITHALTAFMDISERKKYQAELKSLSIRDELTGLYNRRGFMTLAEQQLKVAERTKRPQMLLFIDLDGLKKVNDSLGHQVGDEMIADFAKLISEHFRKVDILARLGGDEFAILAEENTKDVDGIIDRLKQKVAGHNVTRADKRYQLSFSVGFAAYYPDQPRPLDELITLADERMYEEKKRKKSERA